jgi:hypothetical protein
MSLPSLPSTEQTGALNRAVAYKDRKDARVDTQIDGRVIWKFQFQPYRSLMNLGLQRAINRIYHVSYKQFHGFC